MSVRFRPTLLITHKVFLNRDYKIKIIHNVTYFLFNFLIKEIKYSSNYTQYFFFNSNRLFNNYRYIQQFLIQSILPFWGRVIFRGKGFRVKNYKKKKITFNFGRSHWTKIVYKSSDLIFKKIKRQNYIFLFKNYKKFLIFSSLIKRIKPINYYTKRGLRLKKQNIQRRFGKISQVVSSLH